MHEIEDDAIARDLLDAATRAAVRRRSSTPSRPTAPDRQAAQPRSRRRGGTAPALPVVAPETQAAGGARALPWPPPRGRACRSGRPAAVAPEARPAGSGRPAAVAPRGQARRGRAPRCSCPPRPGPQGAGAPLQSPPEARPAGGGRAKPGCPPHGVRLGGDPISPRRSVHGHPRDHRARHHPQARGRRRHREASDRRRHRPGGRRTIVSRRGRTSGPATRWHAARAAAGERGPALRPGDRLRHRGHRGGRPRAHATTWASASCQPTTTRFGVDVTPVAFYPPERCGTSTATSATDGRVGTRNYVAIISSVNCSASVSQFVKDRFRDVQTDFPNVDGVLAITHKSGCAHQAVRRGPPGCSSACWPATPGIPTWPPTS